MRKILFNFHLYFALILGVFVVIIGVTGSLIAFEGDLDRLTNLNLYRVTPEGQMLSPSGLLAAAAKAYPAQKVNTIRFPSSPDSAAIFNVRGAAQVFMNPYTGAIIGTRSGSTWLNTAHQLHIRLLLGPTGKNVVAFVSAVLLFLVLSGIYLWWPLKRARVKWNGSARRLSFDLHNAAGIYAAAILLIAGITGLGIHFDDEVEQSLHRSAGTKKVAKNTPSAPQPGAHPIDTDRAVEAALATLPGTQLLAVSAPANPKASYLVALHYPEDLTPGGRSWVNVDQYSGKAVSFQDSRTVPWGTRAIILNRAIHTGDIFGYFSKIVMALTCLILISQAITGYYLWWKKLRARERQASEGVPRESIA
jgi:uncharacterized iron-regulated membrane protein